VWGVKTGAYDPLEVFNSFQNPSAKEILIDTCAGNDVDVNNTYGTILISDLTKADGSGSYVDFGYAKDANGQTCELVELDIALTGDILNNGLSKQTDHNGFWFFSSWQGGENSDFTTEINCVTDTFTYATSNSNHTAIETLITLNHQVGYEDAFVTISGKLTLCDGVTGVNGIGIVFTRSKVTYTDVNGNFSIPIRSDVLVGFGRNLDIVGTPADTLMVVQNGGCFLFNCDDCFCLEIAQFDIPCKDFAAPPTDPSPQNFLVRLLNLGTHGLKSGATYNVGFAGHNMIKQ